jgi:hypothetical protein
MSAVADEPTTVLWRTTPALRTDQFFCDLWRAAADNGFETDMMRAFAVTQQYPDEFWSERGGCLLVLPSPTLCRAW